MENIENRELELAWKIIERTGKNLFLTGKAGTGKTTFLHNLRKKSLKRMIVLAPTGVAAINAGGSTLHSFFQLPFAPHVPNRASAKDQSKFRLRREKVNIIRSLDLLVIDEISMVRADVLDAVDDALRHIRKQNKPFGGVQLLMIGDLQQLAPVMKDDEWNLLRPFYESPFFFASNALKKTDFCTIELRHVYRQNDRFFLDILNAVRENRCTADIIDALNKRFIPNFKPAKTDRYIRLVTHNRQAQDINQREMQNLSGKTFSFEAKVDGNFPEYAYPTDENLTLKKGAQVMFAKNDTSGEHRYYNGMIGEITEIGNDSIKVRATESGRIIDVGKEEWANTKYTLDENTNEIKEEKEGTFRQYPLKLAWAITIHKSQGLTFEHAIIDASEAFAHGQTYVALSRCKTLEGLVLSEPITMRSVISDQGIKQFCDEARRNEPDEQSVRAMQRAYFADLLTDLFDISSIEHTLGQTVRILDEHLANQQPVFVKNCHTELGKIRKNVLAVADKFKTFYTKIAADAPDYETNPTLQNRVQKAAVYFEDQLHSLRPLILAAATVECNNKDFVKRLKNTVAELNKKTKQKSKLLKLVEQNGFYETEYLKAKSLLSLEENDTETTKKSIKAKPEKPSVSDENQHPALYAKLSAWRRNEATRNDVPAFVVFSNKTLLAISNDMPENKTQLLRTPGVGPKLAAKYGEQVLKIIRNYRKTEK